MLNLPSRNCTFEKFFTRFKLFELKTTETNLGEIQKWYEDDHKQLKKAFSTLKSEQELCTMKSPLVPMKLNSFFYPPTLKDRVDDSSMFTPNQIVDLNYNNGVLILGRLGQGKSMLLRYLEFLELNVGNTIPIFLNLHKIESGNSIVEDAIKKFNDLGLNCSSNLFDHLLSNGHVSIFLDGFDEISFEKRNSFIDGIKSILSRSANKRIYITSRHDTEIERIPGLKGYIINPLTEDDHAPFIKKMMKPNDKDIDSILKKISEAKEFDISVLDSPLLLTWFIMVFKVRRKIPKTKIGFYEELFKTILSRHDGNKGSLDRPSKSKLTDDEIEIILHAFCYITSKENVKDFEEKDILKYIQKSLNIADMKTIKAIDYLYDLTHITCLIKKDGMRFSFIHGSIQNYFAACFIKETTEANSRKFYLNADSAWKEWADELNFLYHLDPYRFNKFMIIPTVSNFFKIDEGYLYQIKEITTVTKNNVKDIFSESYFTFQKNSDGELEYQNTYYYPALCHTFHLIFNEGHYQVCDTDKIMMDAINKVFKAHPEFKEYLLKLALKKWDKNSRVYINIKTIDFEEIYLNILTQEISTYIMEKVNNYLSTSFKLVESEDAKGSLF